MKKSVMIVGTLAVLSLCASAFAVSPVTPATPASQPLSPKKQLTACMTKQMTASRAISYYDAMKVCKDLIKSREDSMIASNEARPAHAR